jgi:hypothetical protein
LAAGAEPADAIQIDDLASWDSWLEANGSDGRLVWVVIF